MCTPAESTLSPWNQRVRRTGALGILVAATLSACAQDAAGPPRAHGSERYTLERTDGVGAGEDAPVGRTRPAEEARAELIGAPAEERERSAAESGPPSGDAARDRDGGIRVRPHAGQLTASSLHDNAAYTDFVQSGAPVAAAWGLQEATQRLVVDVRAAGAPVVDAQVTLYGPREAVHYVARTDNHGRAYLFTALAQGRFGVVVNANGRRASKWGVELGRAVTLTLARAPAPKPALDVMFVVDTTGSMGDELEFLKAELGSVIARTQRHSTQALRVRTGAVFYRDHGEAYVVRTHPLSEGTRQTQRALVGEGAAGGGDTPEAADEGLAAAIADANWAGSARARLAFIVLDAPPHQSAEIRARLERTIRAAAKSGVRIVPVVASGMDQSGEGLFRAAAVMTGGRYVHITDDSGIGGRHRAPDTTQQRMVRPLNDLLVDLIGDYVREVGAPVVQR